ncbi:NRDE family protein [Algoriphagus sp. AGSA1]|uniref:NRDE family protein n=1 Tax=Algoriphagus sp. AGSA1 TaxID=2907213 RepID=UPI001F2FF50E|nr:NRDE family protein [Algoriphagus sp. AGSA1]MCE7056975.1 NRDE family protein [Algoriphagus sp. AGSA1]
MCLVALSWQSHPKYPLIISANRDEFYERPSQEIHQWQSGFYGGKDLRSGGTWMGYHPNGRWSLLTNYRDFKNPRNAHISRGKLVQAWLESHISPEEYLLGIQKSQDQYDGFNLLVSDGEKLFYLSNYSSDIREIAPGIYGLSNALIDDPWPKVKLAKTQLMKLIEKDFSTDDLLDILKSTKTYPPEKLPDTGVPLDMETALSAQLIRMQGNYGTVSAIALVQHTTGLVELKQRSYEWKSEIYRDIEYQFHLDQT